MLPSLHVRCGCCLYHSLVCIIPQLKQSALISSRHLSMCLFYCSPSEPLSFNKAIISVQEVGLCCFSFFRTPSLIKDPPDVHKLLALFISLINYSFVEGLHLQEPRTWKELAHGSLIDTAEAECCFFKLGYRFFMILSDAFCWFAEEWSEAWSDSMSLPSLKMIPRDKYRSIKGRLYDWR